MAQNCRVNLIRGGLKNEAGKVVKGVRLVGLDSLQKYFNLSVD